MASVLSYPRAFALKPGPAGETVWMAKLLALALIIGPAINYAVGLPAVIGAVMALLVVPVVGGFVIAQNKAHGASLRGGLWQIAGLASAFGLAYAVGPLKW